MLTVTGSRQSFCDGVSRRNFLKIGAFGASLTLADVLRARAAGGSAQSPATSQKAAIMIYLPGGPSHIDTFDPKPAAPAEFRGEFGTVNTKIPGVQFSQHFTRLAAMADKLAVVRSLVATDEHSDSYVMTGYPERVNAAAAQGQHPSFGSVMSKLRGGTSADIPPFVSLRGMSMGTEPGFLGIAHRPFTPDGYGLSNLKLANGVTSSRLDDRRTLLDRFDDTRRDVDASGAMAGMDAFAQRAFDMVASGTVRKALDLRSEDPRARDRYKGLEPFLTARRLIEAGVGCVTLAYGGWDTHEGNFTQLKRQNPALDRGVANLVQDLHDRGMADDVVTVVWGEFGRTPKVNGGAGRDHWAPVMSALVAGGGLKMGQAIGTSSAKGEYPKDRPLKVPNLLATLYRAVGVDPATTFPNNTGRPMYVLDEREGVAELG
jgi:uncharacterized protein (DUF1501 family)